jgi:predicted NUDIX family NTP pyrophosphohydrolase
MTNTKKTSAGLLMYRGRQKNVEVLLAHPGGPYYAKKDEGVWTIPKGEVSEGEDTLVAACREFEEEIGIAPHPPYLALGAIKQRSGKVVHVWACEAPLDWNDTEPIHSNEFEIEWPPKSGKIKKFPEVDKAHFMPLEEARRKIIPAQSSILDLLEEIMGAPTGVTEDS